MTIPNFFVVTSLIVLLTMAAAAALISSSLFIPVYAQTTTTYTNVDAGFRLQLPTSWVLEEVDIADTLAPEDADEEEREEVRSTIVEDTGGREQVGEICPQEDSVPKIGGGYECQLFSTNIGIAHIAKYHDLQDQEPFEEVVSAGNPITTNDLVAYEFSIEETSELLSALGSGLGLSTFNYRVVAQSDRTTNLVDSETGEVLRNDIPVKEIEYTYTSSGLGQVTNWRGHGLFAVLNDGTTSTGYSITVTENAETVPPNFIDTLPAIQTAFRTFELVQ